MGNAPSLQDETIVPTGPQRLTKPRTNTNSPYSSMSRKDSDSNHSTPSKPSSRGTTSASDGRQSDSADSSFFSHELMSNPSVSPIDNIYYHDSPSTSAPNLVHGLAPSSGLSCSSNRHSIATDGSDIDIGAAIALLQHLKKNASPEDLVALHKALLPTRSVDPEVSVTIAETQEPEETFSPLIRRSSLLPAGLATRISLEAIKRKTSRRTSQREKRRQIAQSAHRQEPGTWEQFVEGGFDSLAITDKRSLPRPGAATPSDFELTHIGNYELGSLRVTNGAASPEPSLILNLAEQAASVRTASGSTTVDGFVTADEGESGPESVPINQTAPRKPRSAVGPRLGANSSGSRSLPKTRFTQLPNVSTGGDGSHNEPAWPSTRGVASPHLPRQQAVDMAQDYMEECQLPVSPYTEGAPLSALASRLSTVEDNSPVDEPIGGPKDALRKLTGASSPSQSRQVSGTSDSSASRVDTDDRTQLQEPRRPSIQAKPDSGYSSESSWQAQAKAHIRGTKVDDILKSALVAASRTEHSRVAPLPPSAAALTVSSGPSLDNELHAVAITAAEARPLSKPQASRHQSMPIYVEHLSSASTSSVPTLHTPSPSTKEEKHAKEQKQYKKLQKPRPQANQPPTVQSLKEVVKADTVPDVPDTVSVNFSRRLVHRPDMSHLDQTFASVDETAHRKEDTSSTVTDGLNHLNGEEDESRGRDRRQKSKPDAEAPAPEKRRSFLGRLRSRSRSKSQHRSSKPLAIADNEPMPSMSDFGTVAQSLGGSPYDIATRHVKTRQSIDGKRPLFHPHEITSDLSQPMVSMDDETAAEYARLRSRDIAEQQSDDRRARSLSRSRRTMTDEARTKDQPRLPKTQSVSVQSSPASARPAHKRSISAHPSIVQRVPAIPKHDETPERPRVYRVGTIKFEGGEAQGRVSPIQMERPRNKRRTQSVSPRVLRSVEKTELLDGDRVEIPDVPKLTPPTSAVTYTKEGSQVSPSHYSMSPVSWDDQARLWRERKKSLVGTLTPPAEKRRSLTGSNFTSPSTTQQYTPTKQAPRHSPAIVISRYITPTGAELEAHIGNVKVDDPYAAFHAADPTDHLPAREDVDRTDSAISTSSFKTVNSAISYDSHSSGPSHDAVRYQAYHPANAVSVSRFAQRPVQPRHGRPQAGPKRSNTAPITGPDVSFDRYSGGLGYGWERGSGFGGSAGTRQGSDQSAKRKSVKLSESFGVDLSDVPVFLTRG